MLKKITIPSLLSIFFIVSVLSNNSFAQENSVFDDLNWTLGPGIAYHLNEATIELTVNEQSVSGSDANKILTYINRLPSETDLFISIYSRDSRGDFLGYINYDFYNSGYVKLDEWKDVNPDKFLKDKKEMVKEQNKEIIASGSQNIITDTKWLTEPTLDKNTKTVYYAIKYTFKEGGPSINATTLILGRHGYTDATLVMDPIKFAISGKQILSYVRSSYKFTPQKEYSKYTKGDKIAAVGIGGLLAASLGIKVFKAGGLAALLIFAKKFAFILLIPLIALFTWMKNIFVRNN